MAETKNSDKPDKAGDGQARPKKLLNNGVDPAVGQETQFKPGQSGNPAGMPKGYKHINTWIQELVSDVEFEARLIDPKSLQITDYKGAPMKAIIKSLIHIALTHPDYEVRMKAMEKLFKYGYPTKNEFTGEDGAPLLAPVVRIIDERPQARVRQDQ